MEIAGEVTSSLLQTNQFSQHLSFVSYDLIADVSSTTVKEGVGMSKTYLQPIQTQKLIDSGDLFNTAIIDQPDVLTFSLSTDLSSRDRPTSLSFDSSHSPKDILIGVSVEAPLTHYVENDSLLRSKEPLGGISSEIDRFGELAQIDQLVNAARELGTIKELDKLGLGASPQIQDLLNVGLGNTGDRQPGLGQFPQKDPNTANSFGFDDPLNGHRSQRPGSTVVGAGSIPTVDSLVSQQSGYRDRQWSSADGLTTWGHSTYPDGSRIASRTDRHEDGSYTQWSMVWGQSGQVESFGYEHHRVSDGHAIYEYTGFENGVKVTRGYEIDENGVTIREWGSDLQKPTSGESTPKGNKEDIAKYQPSEAGGGGGSYNPFTGQYWGSEIKLSANQVNPNPDAPNLNNAPRLAIDSRDLVINPGLEIRGGAEHNPHRFDSRDRINPPRL